MEKVAYVGYPKCRPNHIFIVWPDGLAELQTLNPWRQVVRGAGIPIAKSINPVLFANGYCTIIPDYIARTVYGLTTAEEAE